MLAFCKRLSLVLGAVVGVAFASGVANAQTTTPPEQFDVLITINAYCEVTNPTDLNFGAPSLLNAVIDVNTSVDVQCTDTTPFDIGLNQGLNFTTTRNMTDGTNLIQYELYQDAGRTTPWGDVVGTDTLADAGTGIVVNYPIHGRVPVQTTPAPGNYVDTVEIVVTY